MGTDIKIRRGQTFVPYSSSASVVDTTVTLDYKQSAVVAPRWAFVRLISNNNGFVNAVRSDGQPFDADAPGPTLGDQSAVVSLVKIGTGPSSTVSVRVECGPATSVFGYDYNSSSFYTTACDRYVDWEVWEFVGNDHIYFPSIASPTEIYIPGATPESQAITGQHQFNQENDFTVAEAPKCVPFHRGLSWTQETAGVGLPGGYTDEKKYGSIGLQTGVLFGSPGTLASQGSADMHATERCTVHFDNVLFYGPDWRVSLEAAQTGAATYGSTSETYTLNRTVDNWANTMILGSLMSTGDTDKEFGVAVTPTPGRDDAVDIHYADDVTWQNNDGFLFNTVEDVGGNLTVHRFDSIPGSKNNIDGPSQTFVDEWTSSVETLDFDWDNSSDIYMGSTSFQAMAGNMANANTDELGSRPCGLAKYERVNGSNDRLVYNNFQDTHTTGREYFTAVEVYNFDAPGTDAIDGIIDAGIESQEGADYTNFSLSTPVNDGAYSPWWIGGSSANQTVTAHGEEDGYWNFKNIATNAAPSMETLCASQNTLSASALTNFKGSDNTKITMLVRDNIGGFGGFTNIGTFHIYEPGTPGVGGAYIGGHNYVPHTWPSVAGVWTEVVFDMTAFPDWMATDSIGRVIWQQFWAGSNQPAESYDYDIAWIRIGDGPTAVIDANAKAYPSVDVTPVQPNAFSFDEGDRGWTYTAGAVITEQDAQDKYGPYIRVQAPPTNSLLMDSGSDLAPFVGKASHRIKALARTGQNLEVGQTLNNAFAWETDEGATLGQTNSVSAYPSASLWNAVGPGVPYVTTLEIEDLSQQQQNRWIGQTINNLRFAPLGNFSATHWCDVFVHSIVIEERLADGNYVVVGTVTPSVEIDETAALNEITGLAATPTVEIDETASINEITGADTKLTTIGTDTYEAPYSIEFQGTSSQGYYMSYGAPVSDFGGGYGEWKSNLSTSTAMRYVVNGFGQVDFDPTGYGIVTIRRRYLDWNGDPRAYSYTEHRIWFRTDSNDASYNRYPTDILDEGDGWYTFTYDLTNDVNWNNGENIQRFLLYGLTQSQAVAIGFDSLLTDYTTIVDYIRIGNAPALNTRFDSSVVSSIEVRPVTYAQKVSAGNSTDSYIVLTESAALGAVSSLNAAPSISIDEIAALSTTFLADASSTITVDETATAGTTFTAAANPSIEVGTVAAINEITGLAAAPTVEIDETAALNEITGLDASPSVEIDSFAAMFKIHGLGASPSVEIDETASLNEITGLDASPTVEIDETAAANLRHGGSAAATVEIDETSAAQRLANASADATVEIDETAAIHKITGLAASPTVEIDETAAANLLPGGFAAPSVTIDETSAAQRLANASADATVEIDETADIDVIWSGTTCSGGGAPADTWLPLTPYETEDVVISTGSVWTNVELGPGVSGTVAPNKENFDSGSPPDGDYFTDGSTWWKYVEEAAGGGPAECTSIDLDMATEANAAQGGAAATSSIEIDQVTYSQKVSTGNSVDSYIVLTETAAPNAVVGLDADATIETNETAAPNAVVGLDADATIEIDETSAAQRLANASADATVEIDATSAAQTIGTGNTVDPYITINETAASNAVVGLEADATIEIDETSTAQLIQTGSSDATIEIDALTAAQRLANASADSTIEFDETAAANMLATGIASPTVEIDEIAEAQLIQIGIADSTIDLLSFPHARGGAIRQASADSSIVLDETAALSSRIGGTIDSTITVDEAASLNEITGLGASPTVEIDETAALSSRIGGSAAATVETDATAAINEITGLAASPTVEIDETAGINVHHGGDATSSIEIDQTTFGVAIGTGNTVDAYITFTSDAALNAVAGLEADATITVDETADLHTIQGADVTSTVTVDETSAAQRLAGADVTSSVTVDETAALNEITGLAASPTVEIDETATPVRFAGLSANPSVDVDVISGGLEVGDAEADAYVSIDAAFEAVRLAEATAALEVAVDAAVSGTDIQGAFVSATIENNMFSDSTLILSGTSDGTISLTQATEATRITLGLSAGVTITTLSTALGSNVAAANVFAAIETQTTSAITRLLGASADATIQTDTALTGLRLAGGSVTADITHDAATLATAIRLGESTGYVSVDVTPSVANAILVGTSHGDIEINAFSAGSTEEGFKCILDIVGQTVLVDSLAATQILSTLLEGTSQSLTELVGAVENTVSLRGQTSQSTLSGSAASPQILSASTRDPISLRGTAGATDSLTGAVAATDDLTGQASTVEDLSGTAIEHDDLLTGACHKE